MFTRKLMRINPKLITKREGMGIYSSNYLSNLTDHIRKNGLFDPITVAKIGDGNYALINGSGRLRACELLEYETIPAFVFEGLTENEIILMRFRS